MTVSNTAVQLGSFGNAVSGLEVSRSYYYRAYAKNDTKTFYGETKKFATLSDKYVTLPGGLVVATEDAGKADWFDAVTMCDNYTSAGFTDWRLPTLDELMTVYNNKNTVGNFKDDCYWSSDYRYIDMYLVWYIDFSDGQVGSTFEYAPYYSSYYVRCVRIAQ